MWAEACQLIDQAERLHRQFFRISTQPREVPVWEPPIDMFEDGDQLAVVVALPGVSSERIEVSVESGALMVRAERRIPFSRQSFSVQRLEIPHGLFERRINLPAAKFVLEAREWKDGCLILVLRKVNQ
jgi:HSP20 family molecular chaperone IbpA